jgi:HK97 family phage prohead protease
MEHKDVDLGHVSLKATAGDGWEVSGYASTFSTTPDATGDVVERGAFLASLGKRKTRLLWQHDLGKPIGRELELREDGRGLWGRWSIVPTAQGREARELLAAGLIDSFSIGYTPTDYGFRADGTRILKAVELFEVSLVTIPANAGATVEDWKGHGRPAPDLEPLRLRAEVLKRKALLRQRLRLAGLVP